METKHKATIVSLLKGSTTAFSLNVVSAILTLGINVLITRYLDIKDSGAYFLAISFLLIGWTFCSLGLNPALTKLIANAHVGGCIRFIKELLNKAQLYTLKACLAFITLLLFADYFLDLRATYFQNSTSLIIFLLLSLICYCSYNLICSSLLAVGRTLESVLVSKNIFQICFLFLILTIGIKDLNVLGGLYFVASVVTLIISLWLWRKFINVESSAERIKKNHTSSESLFNIGIPIWGGQVVAQLNAQGGQVMLGIIGDPTSIALVSIAVKVAGLCGFVLIAVNRIVSPKFAQAHQKGDLDELTILIKWSTRFSFFAGLPLFLGIVIFPELILSLFGDDYIQASDILVILAIAQLINISTGSVGFLLNMSGFHNLQRNIIIFSSCLSLMVGIIATMNWGLHGAILMITLSLVLNNLLSCYFVYKKLGINTIKCLFT